MPKLICDCGTEFQFKENELRAAAGKPFTCNKCGKTRTVPLPKVFTPALRPGFPRRRNWSWRQTVVCLAVLLVIGIALYGGGFLMSKPGAERIPLLGRVLPDPDKAAVDTWLKENLNDPEWEEVKWWPAITMTEWKRRNEAQRVKDIDEAMKEEEDYLTNNGQNPLTERQKQDLQQSRKAKEQYDRETLELTFPMLLADPPRVCRLKFRAKNGLGGRHLDDFLFIIDKNGKAARAENWLGFRAYFPD